LVKNNIRKEKLQKDFYLTARFAQAILSIKRSYKKRDFLYFKIKKEVLLSIIIGIILGFGIMGFTWVNRNGGFANLSQKIVSSSNQEEAARNENEKVVSPTPTTIVENNEVDLLITEPENEIVVSQEKLSIKGKTQSLATVVIIWEEGEDILVADKDGLFETQITLLGGPNEIEVTAYGKNDNEVKKILTVTYSTAKF
jgi:hypothetical protein